MKTIRLFCLWSLAALWLAGVSGVQAQPAAPAAAATNAPANDSKELAVIHVTQGTNFLGTMVLEFYPDVAPKHVANFKKLARSGFYDGTCFHRVINGFMIQGGDPNTKSGSVDTWGMGGPGYNVNAEFNSKHHARGILSMARANDPNSAGSQFFICQADCGQLDGQYTVFGNLVKGYDVLDKIASTATEGPDRPVTRVNIDSIKIVPASSLNLK